MLACDAGAVMPRTTRLARPPVPPPPVEAVPPPVEVLAVRAHRLGCLGKCPSFEVLLDADGRVEWRGHAFVEEVGVVTASVDAAQAKDVLAAFGAVDPDALPKDGDAECDGFDRGSSLRVVLETASGRVEFYANANCWKPAATRPLVDADHQLLRLVDAEPWIGHAAGCSVYHGQPWRYPNTENPADIASYVTDAMRTNPRARVRLHAHGSLEHPTAGRASADALIGELAQLGAETQRIEVHDHGTDLAERAAREGDAPVAAFIYVDMVDLDCALDPRGVRP